MMNLLDVLGYVLAVATVLVLTLTLGGPVVRQRLLVQRLRRDMKTIDATVVSWARDPRIR